MISLVLFYFYLESRYYVCPNGKLVDFDFQCEKFSPEKLNITTDELYGFQTDLSKSEHRYVLTLSEIVLLAKIEHEGIVSFKFSPSNLNISQGGSIRRINGSDYFYYQNNQVKRLTPNLNGLYEIKLLAPEIPGEYFFYGVDYGTTSQSYSIENLTVIGQTNDTLAYAIADRQLYISFGSSTSFIRNWTTTSKYILDKGNFYETYMENSFDFCEMGVRNFICESKTVSGKFLISKETGQIIG